MFCKKCAESTKYACIQCKVPVCNRSLSCSVPVSEAFEGWKTSACVALCIDCDVLQFQTDDDQEVVIIKDCEEPVIIADGTLFDEPNTSSDCDRDIAISYDIMCASRGFHETRKFWKPKDHQRLEIAEEKCNLFYPYAMCIKVQIPTRIEPISIVGHIPREIPRFCYFSVKHGGLLHGNVSDIKYRRSPLPQGGLEIPMTLSVYQGKATAEEYDSLKSFI